MEIDINFKTKEPSFFECKKILKDRFDERIRTIKTMFRIMNVKVKDGEVEEKALEQLEDSMEEELEEIKNNRNI